jgi:hypothetical protein
MSKNIRQLFKVTKVSDSAIGLEGRVLAHLKQEQKCFARRNLVVFGLVDLLSASGLIASGFYLASLSASSGFYNYLSLLWLDRGVVIGYWQELLFSLMDSLPVVGVIAFLAVALALILSLAKTMANFKLFYSPYGAKSIIN